MLVEIPWKEFKALITATAATERLLDDGHIEVKIGERKFVTMRDRSIIWEDIAR